MITPKIIGLAGPEGAGKTTVARILEGCHGYSRVPFAAPIKKMIRALGVDWRHTNGTPEEKAAPLAIFGGKSARHAMQTLGTEWGRQCIGPDFWCGAWAAEAARHDLIVADDVRFPNEADRVRAMGGVVWCIVRSHDDLRRVPQHASEDFAAVRADEIIVNNGTIAALEEKLQLHLNPQLALAI